MPNTLTIVPAREAIPLQTVRPEDTMYIPVPDGEVGVIPAPFLSVENIQAVAIGFVQMHPGSVSEEELNADDRDDA